MTTVLVCGTFDLLHVGHLNLLHRARDRCDVLIVGVFDGPDSKQRVLTTDERVAQMKATRIPDVVRPYSDPLAFIASTDPDVVVQGDDWWNTGPSREEIAELLGDRLELVPRTPGISSRDIKERVARLWA